jgi:hypothetical protein
MLKSLSDIHTSILDFLSTHTMDPANPFAQDVLRRLPEGGQADWQTGPAEWADALQQLSTVHRKGNALVQTPTFVAEYLVNYLVVNAIDQDGERAVFLDPSAGGGHLLEALLDRLELEICCDADQALEQVRGVELDPLTAALARLRVALWWAERNGWSWPAAEQVQVWEGDALALFAEGHPAYQGVHGIAANPPYITPPEASARALYRRHYVSAHGRFQMSAPFIEMCMRALAPTHGLMAMIVSNGFQKREFGKALIERVLPQHTLAALVDTSGAYLPGYGTPTCILFARGGACRRCQARGVFNIAGKRGEPATPKDPAQGKVWQAIVGASVAGRLDKYLTCSGHGWGILPAD